MELLDTDVLIDVQRGYPPAIEWFAGLRTCPAVPGFVVMELIQDAGNSRQLQQAMKLVEPLPVIWPSRVDCARALEHFRTWHLSHRLGLLDALIAACALGASATLCTFNIKHYQLIPQLTLAQPYRRT